LSTKNMAVAKRVVKRASDNAGYSRKATAKPIPVDNGGAEPDTRARLLSAAIELFGTLGFDSTSMKQLGAHAGVGAPAAYNHFPSKDAILAEAVTWAMEGFASKVTNADNPSAPALERLERLVKGHILWQIEHSRLARANDLLISSDLLKRVGQRATYKRIRAMLRKHFDLVTDIVREVLREHPATDLDPTLGALAIGSMCDDVIKWYRADGKYTPEKIASVYWFMIKQIVGA
jgi:TetR/AcrR family transcriptional regulator, cholesterol catabolism regulator